MIRRHVGPIVRFDRLAERLDRNLLEKAVCRHLLTATAAIWAALRHVGITRSTRRKSAALNRFTVALHARSPLRLGSLAVRPELS